MKLTPPADPLPANLVPWFNLDDGIVSCRKCVWRRTRRLTNDLALALHVSIHLGFRKE